MRFSGEILGSPFADFLREERARVRDAAVDVVLALLKDEDEAAAAAAFSDLSLPHTRRRDSAERALSRVWVADTLEGRAPIGVSVEQAWSSGNRCLRQY